VNGGRTRPAVFLDRDGTLIVDVGYPSNPDDVELVEGAAPALTELRSEGFALVVVSNQSGIARGLVSPEQAAAVHERFVEELRRRGATLDDVRYCPHAPDAGCDCRKPAPGMLITAAEDLGLDLSHSFAIGDKLSDVEAGRLVGCRTILFGQNGDRDVDADHVSPDWPDAVAFIRSMSAS
jgi:D-glycero-D-manno-heptose 1,7-bisphosphate phosphatase